jgi:hypothetical protein
MKLRIKRWSVPSALVLGACSPPSPEMDAGTDAGHDAGIDAGTDAGMDAGYDAGVVDAGHDAGTVDAGPVVDAGVCPHTSPGDNPMYASYEDDAGVRYVCEPFFYPDGGYGECKDPDIGNPCPICCVNPRETDGGREYYADGGAICFC